uniref:Interferon-stimulated 20 kDa exonuclease-like 2 n=1 Tax=Sphaeramia orbicularis TaxID=375764 RepID=A0A673A940_9TELE
MSDVWINASSVSDNTTLTTQTQKKLKKKEKWKKYLERKKNRKLQRTKAPGHSGSKPAPRPNGAKPTPPANWAYVSPFQPSASADTVTNHSSKPSTSTHSSCFLAVSGTKGDDPKPQSQSSWLPSSAGPSASSTFAPSKTLAIDCEMVGAGPKGHISQLARCSIVSYDGDVVYDKFISPSMPVTDYRTRWSGIRRSDLTGATPYAEARKEILKLLMGKVVVGHAIHNDFKVLGYAHPPALTRDTSRFPLLNQKAGFPENQAASLKRLTKAIFNRDIQTGRRGHSSVEDAKATMELYRAVEVEWERTPTSKTNNNRENTDTTGR